MATATAIKAQHTSKYLSPKQAERLQARADTFFKINPSVKQIIFTVDGNIFSMDEAGEHAALEHAKKLKSQIVIEITKGDTIEGGDSAEITASGKPNPEQAARMNSRADAHFKTYKDCERIYLTVDGNIFSADAEGEHAATNHAKRLINTSVFEVTRTEGVDADNDGNEATKEVKEAADKATSDLDSLLGEGKNAEALALAQSLEGEVKQLLPDHIHELLTEAAKA